MGEVPGSPRLIHFGTFEVDLRAGELRRNGVKIKLQEQPFQILAMLLEHPGEVVTREELEKRLWSADTFVDFEHSLATAVKKLREALGDSADNPRFIETLPRRGYRFIAAVAPVYDRRPEDAAHRAALQNRWTLAVAAVLLIAAAMLAYWLTRPLPPPRVTNAVRIARLHGGTWFAPLLTDGVRLYFTDWVGDRSMVMQVPLTGGDAVPFPTPFRYAAATDISLKRSELLVMGGDSWDAEKMPLWVMSLVGGAPRLVGDIMGGGQWSPDGQKILYAKGSDFYLAVRDDKESRKLASAPGTPYMGNWSPDGTTIRFNADDGKTGTSFLYEVSADGTNLHRLLPGWSKPPGGECCGIWTPDGKYFVFAVTRDDRGDLWAIREKGGLFRKPRRDPIPLTTGPVRYVTPLPSADGKKLFAIGTVDRGELVRYEPKAQEFVPYLGGISASDVDFSRDGQWVAYVAWPDGTLWRSRMDGSERAQLTFSPQRVAGPRWSPDGKRIAFMGKLPGKLDKIQWIAFEGGRPQQPISGGGEERDPQWSPDGKQLLFVRPPASEGVALPLHVLDLRTNQGSIVPGSEGLVWPCWSRDGRYVVAMKDGERSLVLFDFTTHRQVKLATSKGGFGWPNWSRDGKWVYLWKDFTEGHKGIYRVRLADHKIELVVSDKEVGRAWGALGPWLGLAPDDAPLVMRDISLTEIYAFDWEAP